MHRSTLTENHAAATTNSSAACQTNKEPKWIRVGRGTYPFSSFVAASAAYCATIDRLGLGVSEAPACEMLDEAGDPIARVAYNGRIFAVGPNGECDYTRVLHEIRGD